MYCQVFEPAPPLHFQIHWVCTSAAPPHIDPLPCPCLVARLRACAAQLCNVANERGLPCRHRVDVSIKPLSTRPKPQLQELHAAPNST